MSVKDVNGSQSACARKPTGSCRERDSRGYCAPTESGAEKSRQRRHEAVALDLTSSICATEGRDAIGTGGGASRESRPVEGRGGGTPFPFPFVGREGRLGGGFTYASGGGGSRRGVDGFVSTTPCVTPGDFAGREGRRGGCDGLGGGSTGREPGEYLDFACWAASLASVSLRLGGRGGRVAGL